MESHVSNALDISQRIAKSMNKTSRENSVKLKEIGFVPKQQHNHMYWCPCYDGTWTLSGIQLNEDDVVAPSIVEVLSWLFTVHKIDFNFEHVGHQSRVVITYRSKSHFTDPIQGFHELLDSAIGKSIEVIMKNP